MKRRLIGAFAVSLSLFGLNVVATDTAQAQTASSCTVGVNCPPYSCNAGDVCLYYNSIENGLNGIFRQFTPIPDYRDSAFLISNYGGEGAGQTVKNNAAAVHNRKDRHFGVFYNSNYSCAVACQQILSLTLKNLNASLKNNNASGTW
ncbi:peptidase inhibitor family I36 protein [Streptomyces cinnabarinus]|uniref:Peptidase inhibitor family I36 protein n=1 Tax=Streptomyces cinnabarinus TaxID=67287 RepID=A0ABY7KNQ2_9ACTN|nr:peptidase inhibitor family I36 protein [Streptomyces cinnabarinus]WAZ26207.1 peptidase inhibitor family I36 protein [Streptomyces cinnabarinus]